MSTQKSSLKDKTAKLDELVAWFNGDDFTLEEALDMFKAAEKLAAEIEHDLVELKNEVHIVKEKFDEA